MGASTICSIVTETGGTLWDGLHSQHMPDADAFNTLPTDFFDTRNFPICVGATGGKHVRLKCPANSGSMFYN
ncbi:hypothetical protein RRG08_040339 [Elysia crispata]|uniref:Uncharacterized protein n=1 Tax=Elysia crispata TaxID=231223 RepID=A0AAE1ASS6_9GAST|nr:hypothetical protein RRG08_040339 [Elysia crispata]